jgi:CheY-like chemotaxis protein
MTHTPTPKLSSVLLVDDDPTTNYLHRLLLTRMNVTTTLLEALNGEQALVLLHDHCYRITPDCPALILLDLKMPVMNGFEFMAAYQAEDFPQKESIIIVMLTTSQHPQDVERAQQLRVAAFLNKPLTSEKVEGILHDYFN